MGFFQDFLFLARSKIPEILEIGIGIWKSQKNPENLGDRDWDFKTSKNPEIPEIRIGIWKSRVKNHKNPENPEIGIF